MNILTVGSFSRPRTLWTVSCAVLLLALAMPGRAVERRTLSGHVPTALARLQAVSNLPPSTNMHLAIGLPLRNQAGLTNLLQQLYDPTSTNYHQYLTPEQFTERFGPTVEDYQAVMNFAATNGLTVTTLHPNRVVLDVSGPASAIEQAFQVSFHVYRHPTENRNFFAVDREPSVPSNLQVLDISGLNNYQLPHPNMTRKPVIKPSKVTPNVGSAPDGASYLGKDFRAAYAPGTRLTGAGQTVALLQFDGYFPEDIAAYEGLAGLPSVPLVNILLDGFNGNPSGNEGEVSLDIEMVVSMAPGVSKILVYEGGPFGFHDDILNRIATDNAAHQISASWTWGGGPSATTDQIFQQMDAQGQSFFHSSGDFDAILSNEIDDPNAVIAPSDGPYITQVGGTTLTTSGPEGTYVSETVWNYVPLFGGGRSGSSGGISTFYSIPTWQQGINMGPNLGSTAFRNFPDVALTGDAVWVVADGFGSPAAGTSCASPLWAGFAALINQQAAESGEPPIGFINPAIYAIGKNTTTYGSAFHDVTTGDNAWSGSAGQFPAVAGYDLATGWGSPSGTNLINILAPPRPGPIFTLITNMLSGGNGNGLIDPDECNTMDLVLANVGTADASGVQATLSSSTPGVIVAQRTSGFTNIAVGSSATNITSYKVSTSPTFICGSTISFTLVVKCDQSTATLGFQVATGTPGIPVRYDTETQVPIPQGNPAGTNSPIVVSNITSALSHVSVAVMIAHPLDFVLALQLVGPDGTTVLLSQNNGGGGQNYGQDCLADTDRTIFDDGASNSISSGAAPFVGVFQPQQSLSVYEGKTGTNINGTWNLHVVDQFGGFGTGIIDCWSLILTPSTCTDGGGQCPGTDLAVGMNATPGPIIVGDTITYTITVTNNGPDTATGVSVNQTLPASVVYISGTSSQGSVTHSGTLVTCNMGTLVPGAIGTLTVQVQTTLAGIITSSVQVGGLQTDFDPSNNSASLSTVVNVPTADLSFSMTGTPNPVLLSGVLTYTMTVSNRGPSQASIIVATNQLPASSSFISGSGSQGTVGFNGSSVIWSVGSLARGASATATIATRANVLGAITANGGVGAHEPDPVPGNNKVSVTTQVTPAADLFLSMSGSPASVIYKSNVTYTLNLLNLGPTAATNVTVNDALPPGMTFVSASNSIGSFTNAANNIIWNVTTTTNFGVGARASLTIVAGTGSLTNTNAFPLTLTNTAVASSTLADPATNNNSAMVLTVVDLATNRIVAAGASLTAESFSPPNGAIDSNETVTVMLGLQNVGNVNGGTLQATLLATNGVTPVGSPTQTYGVLQTNAAPTFMPFTFTASGTNGATITANLQLQDGTASVFPLAKYKFILSASTNFSNPTTIAIPDPQLNPNLAGPANPFASTNVVSGVSNVVGKVTVTVTNFNHTFSDDVSMLLVGPGSNPQKVLLLSHIGGTSGVTNASLTFDDGAATPLFASSGIISGTWKPSVNGTWPTNFPAGPYATNLSAFVGTAPNGPWTLYVYDSSVGDAGSIIGGWKLGLVSDQPVNQVADLGVSGVATPNPVLGGDNLTYTFTITNIGPSAASAVAFTNSLPPGVTLVSKISSQGVLSYNPAAGVNGEVYCNFTNLNAGAGATVTIAVATYPGVTNINSVGTVGAPSGSVFDLNTANNSVTVSTAVTAPKADLAVGISATPLAAVVGSNVSYVIAVTNNGPDTAYGVVVTDQLPAGLTYFGPGSFSSAGAVTINGGVVSCAFLNPLASGASATVNVGATVLAAGSITNTGGARTDSSDTNLVNNSASVAITATTPAPLVAAMGEVLLSENLNFNHAIDPGETVTISFVLANNGTAPTTNLVATLANTGGVSSQTGPRTYGALAAGGGSASNSFTFTASGVNGGTLVATLLLQDGATALPAVSFTNNLPATNTFANSGTIIIPDHGPATPYPSAITVSNMAGLVSKVTVTLRNLNHTFPDDIDILLVSPSGENTILMSDTGGAHAVNNVTLSFDDAASGLLPDSAQIVTGTYLPTDYNATNDTPDVFPGAPAGPYAAGMFFLNGAQPNGNWLLYVFDDSVGDSGNIAGGWSINVATVSALPTPILPSASPTLSSIKSLGGGLITFTVVGQAGKTYVVEASTSLTPPSFTPVYTNTAATLTGLIPVSSGFRYTNSDAGTFPRRFYRARAQ